MISILSRLGVSNRRMSLAISGIAAVGPDRLGEKCDEDAIEKSWQLVRDKDQVVHVLRRILETGQEVTLGDRSGRHLVRGKILAMVNSREGHVLIEAKAEKVAEAALLGDERINLASRYLDLPVAFSVLLSDAGAIGGRSLFRASLPDLMLFSDLRDSQRVTPPSSQAMRAIFDVRAGTVIEAEVMDISEGGLGLLLPQRPDGRPVAGECWQQVMLRSHEGESCMLDLELRHVRLVQGNLWRVGASIEAASEQDRQHLLRMLIRHQKMFTD